MRGDDATSRARGARSLPAKAATLCLRSSRRRCRRRQTTSCSAPSRTSIRSRATSRARRCRCGARARRVAGASLRGARPTCSSLAGRASPSPADRATTRPGLRSVAPPVGADARRRSRSDAAPSVRRKIDVIGLKSVRLSSTRTPTARPSATNRPTVAARQRRRRVASLRKRSSLLVPPVAFIESISRAVLA